MNNFDNTNITNTQQIAEPKIKRNNPKLQNIVFVLCVLFIVILSLDYLHIISIHSMFSSNPAAKVIEKVGKENIYQKDLDTELQYYALPNSPSAKTDLLHKIEKDSITLQAADQEGLATLDTSIFNSVNKDYLKRVAAVAAIKKIIAKRQETISGSVVSIWFYNNSKPSKLPIEQTKATAYKKISTIYELVKSKKVTMKQAGDLIAADKSLADIDIAYKTNAYYDFSVSPNSKFVFDPVFEEKIKKLEIGQLSELYTGKDKELVTNKMIDAVYMFAQVSGRNPTGVSDSYEDWYAKKEKTYAIKKY